MARPGPKNKPAELRIIEGNPGKRPIPETIAAPRPSNPPGPPAHLTVEAKTEWRRQASALHKIGLLTGLDRGTFAAYCQAYGDWVVAQKALNDLRKKGGAGAFLSKTSNNNVIQNPLVGIANTARRDMMKFAAEFGLTPSARTQISANDPKTPSTPGRGTGRFFGQK